MNSLVCMVKMNTSEELVEITFTSRQREVIESLARIQNLSKEEILKVLLENAISWMEDRLAKILV